MTKQLQNYYILKGYKIPICPFISRMTETERFCIAEDNIIKAIRKSADQWVKLYRERGIYQDIYMEVMPEVLRAILERFDDNISELASITYLEKRGFTVDKIVDKSTEQ